ncbi:MAG: hypothetical protein PQJ59_01755 [Spirochaetales bacterium]|nr:hypothetical protein [Spirochaetales bacterium]
MIELSRQDMADLRGCHVSTVSKAGLPKLKGGKYDLLDPDVWEWVTAPTVAAGIRESGRKVRQGTDVDDLGASALDDELVRENIEYKRRQSRKLDLEHEVKTRELIPVQDARLILGAFGSAIDTNLLTVGNKIARGDIKLRNRIEKAVKKGIERTKKAAQLEAKRIIDQELDL